MPKILLVANPGDHDELSAALRGGDDDDLLAVATLIRGVGDDVTLARFVDERPEVVVVAASLEDGDARALISAMRDAVLPAQPFVVMIGDVDGPLRTALDAIGAGIDRFVSRPLSAKALRYAVSSGLARAAVQAMSDAVTVPVVVPVTQAVAEPVPVPDLRARWAALADQLGDDDDDDDDDDDAPIDAEEVGDADVIDEGLIEDALAAELDDPDGPDRVVVTLADPPIPRASTTRPPPPPLPPPPAETWRPGSTEVPEEAEPDDLEPLAAVLPRREPTLVLSERMLPEEPTSERGPIGWRTAAPGPLLDDLGDEALDDVAAGIDDDLSVDLAPERPRDALAPPPPPVAPPPAGGDFARELRKKMSLMAERLFRGGDLPAAPVSIGPAHDHHTEIDLGDLVDDGAEVDLAAATFVGAEERLTDPHAGRDTRETRDPRGAEAGDLQRGVADAPALIARMFAADFTGRVVFRHRDAEKIVHFEGGRPVFASSNLIRDRMGELLVREGKITREQHDRCHDLVRDTGRRMGEILVDRGFLKRRELLPAVRRHVEDILYSLFAWDSGEYRIVAGDGATAERIRLSRHPAAMVLEGVRRKLDRPTLERLVGPPTTLIETTDRDKLAATIGVADLSAEERAALAALDGATELAAVARHAALSLPNLYPLVWSLQLLGLATTRRRAGDDDGDAPALVGESDLAIDRDRVRARAALVADSDYFALLGVRRDATGFEIKRAYEAARRDFATESFPGELRRELEGELDEIAVVLDEAYRVLRDDALRAAYRTHLREPGEAA